METKPTSDHAVMTFGRMNPVTIGHKKLVNIMQSHAWKTGADVHVFLSHTQDPEKNPLTHKEKVHFAQQSFPHAHVHEGSNVRTAIDAVKHLGNKGYKHVTMFVGADRHQEFHNLLHKYNGKEYNIPHLEVKSAGTRDPDAEGVEGMSASKMRRHARDKNFTEFRKGVPNKEHAKELYHAVRKGMKLESVQPHFKALFLVGGPGSGKDFIVNSMLGESVIELPLEKLVKAIAEQSNLEEFNNYPSLVINGNADNIDKVIVSKHVLESMGYDTAMIYVYTTDAESKTRNDERIARGVKTLSEEVRHEKYDSSTKNMHEFTSMFESFFLFDNSNDFATVSPAKKQEIIGWLEELGSSVGSFFGTNIKNKSAQIWLMENAKPKKILGFPQRPLPTPVPAPKEPHKSSLPGYKRVKDGKFWKLVKEAGMGAPGSIGDHSGGETDKGEPMAKDYPKPKKKFKDNPDVAKSSGKGSGRKASSPPPDFFDSRMGAVPSGGVGITVSHYEHDGETVIQEKTLDRLRKNMSALISNPDKD